MNDDSRLDCSDVGPSPEEQDAAADIQDSAPLEDEEAGITLRRLQTGIDTPTTVHCVDLPSFGGACHEYRITGDNCEQTIKFQEGPVQEHGVNGIHHEDLLVILIDRLEHFQAGEFACSENGTALDKLKKALWYLNLRTRDRKTRNVEGTNQL